MRQYERSMISRLQDYTKPKPVRQQIASEKQLKQLSYKIESQNGLTDQLESAQHRTMSSQPAASQLPVTG